VGLLVVHLQVLVALVLVRYLHLLAVHPQFLTQERLRLLVVEPVMQVVAVVQVLLVALVFRQAAVVV
jgi:hypothetical protein